jgi:hypothetical protein
MAILLMRIKGFLAGVMARMLKAQYAGKEIEVRTLDTSGRTYERSPGIRESVRGTTVRETRTIEGVTYQRFGKHYLFFLNASRPVLPPETDSSTMLGPLSGRATRIPKDIRSFNVQSIERDPETGALYFLQE